MWQCMYLVFKQDQGTIHLSSDAKITDRTCVLEKSLSSMSSKEAQDVKHDMMLMWVYVRNTLEKNSSRLDTLCTEET